MAHLTLLVTTLLSLSLLISNQSPTVAADKSLIQTTCNRTSFPVDCVSGLESDARSLKADSTGLARIAVETLQVKIQTFLPVVSDYVNKAHDYATWSMFLTCKDLYSETTGGLDSALKSFDEHKYDVVYGGLVNVSSNINGCRNFGLKEIAQQNDMLFRFSNVSMGIVRLHF